MELSYRSDSFYVYRLFRLINAYLFIGSRPAMDAHALLESSCLSRVDHVELEQILPKGPSVPIFILGIRIADDEFLRLLL